jgi:hypothetical protein
MQEKNLEKLLESVGNIEITGSELKSLEWLSNYEPSTINNICSILEKMKNRGAGRKKRIDPAAIKNLKSEGMTQEEVARELNISISTVRRNWR